MFKLYFHAFRVVCSTVLSLFFLKPFVFPLISYAHQSTVIWIELLFFLFPERLISDLFSNFSKLFDDEYPVNVFHWYSHLVYCSFSQFIDLSFVGRSCHGFRFVSFLGRLICLENFFFELNFFRFLGFEACLCLEDLFSFSLERHSACDLFSLFELSLNFLTLLLLYANFHQVLHFLKSQIFRFWSVLVSLFYFTFFMLPKFWKLSLTFLSCTFHFEYVLEIIVHLDDFIMTQIIIVLIHQTHFSNFPLLLNLLIMKTFHLTPSFDF